MHAVAYIGEWFKTAGARDVIRNIRREGEPEAYVATGCFQADGTPADISSAEEVRLAMGAGSQIVFRLPVIAVLSGYDVQAFATLSLCDNLSIIDRLAVPVHGLSKEKLREIALFLFSEPLPYQKRVRAYLAEGLRFDEARAKSAEAFVSGAAQVLLNPLNSYAVELALAKLRRYSRVSLELIETEEAERPSAKSPACSDRRMAEEFTAFLAGRTPEELKAVTEMTASCPYSLAGKICENRDILMGMDSFPEIIGSLKDDKLSEEQVRRGLMMLLLGIRLSNLSIASLESFCPYIRVAAITEEEQAAAAWIESMKRADARAIAMDGRPLSISPLDESRAHLAAFDTASDQLWKRVTSA